MSIVHHLKPKSGKEIPFIVLVSFLGTFLASRAVVILFPTIFLQIKTVHVHHFSYGIVLLALSNLYLLLQPRSEKTRVRFSIIYGIALGLAFDEFGMWIDLEENAYWSRQSYDAIMIVSLFLLNIIYFADFWKRWGLRLTKLVKLIFSPN